MVVAEAVGGRFIVEAIGRKGVVVRLTVKRESLIQPQPDFFMATKIELTEKLKELKRALSLIPMSKRKEVLAKGMEISRQRKELVELKRERDQLAASSLMEGKMDSAVQRTTSGDGVAQTSKTPGGQPGSTMA